jgi:uncharacterized membrane protein
MKRNKYLSIFWIVLGAALIACGAAGVLDEYWSGMGGAFVAVGAVQIIRYVRLSRNEAYRERIETDSKDERNRFLGGKAWAWAGYLFVIIAAVASVGLRIAGKDELSLMASGSVCLMIVLYWGSYFYLRRKY